MHNEHDANIRIDRSTYKRLKVSAARMGATLKELVEMLSFAKTKRHDFS